MKKKWLDKEGLSSVVAWVKELFNKKPGRKTEEGGEIFNGATSANTFAHAEGSQTQANGLVSHAEGNGTVASGQCSHTEGYTTQAIGDYSHAEGIGGIASGENSHVEGSGNKANGESSHAEGSTNTATGINSHTEGAFNTAAGQCSHAEGKETEAKGDFSHAEGEGTIANKNQHVQGKFNIEDTENKFAFIIGNGDSVENTTQRSNAFAISWDGKIYTNNSETGVDVNTLVPSDAEFTDTKVEQTNATNNANYRLILSNSANNNTETERVYKSEQFTANPSTGVITATRFIGQLEGNANTATKATSDNEGQQIDSTYIKGLSIDGHTITYTKGNGSKETITIEDKYYQSKNVVGSSTATSNTTSKLTNGNVYLNSVENGIVTSTHNIKGTGATTVTTDINGNIIIDSKDATSQFNSYLSLSGGTMNTGAVIQIPSTAADRRMRYTGEAINHIAPSASDEDWTTGINLYKTNGTSLIGSIKAYGIGDTLNWYYLGTDNKNPIVKITPSGTITTTEVIANVLDGELFGNASTATKLQTARTINGVPFDGTADITIPRSTRHVHSADGTNNARGYVKICKIKVTGTYCNHPLKLTISQRTVPQYDIHIMFNSTNNTDPGIQYAYFVHSFGTHVADVWLVKTAAGTHDLYIGKKDRYDGIHVLDCTKGDTGGALNYGIIWTNVQVSEVPTGLEKIQLQNALGSIVTKNAGDYLPISGGTLNAGAKITIPLSDSDRYLELRSSGAHFVAPSNSNWAAGITYYKSDGTSAIGGIKAFGTGDTLEYYYLGADWADPIIKIDTSGNITRLGNVTAKAFLGNASTATTISSPQTALYKKSSLNASPVTVNITGLFTKYKAVVCNVRKSSTIDPTNRSYFLPLTYIKTCTELPYYDSDGQFYFQYIDNNNMRIHTGFGQGADKINAIEIISLY